MAESIIPSQSFQKTAEKLRLPVHLWLFSSVVSKLNVKAVEKLISKAKMAHDRKLDPIKSLKYDFRGTRRGNATPK